MGRSLEKLSKDEVTVQFEHTGLDRLMTEVDRSSNRVVIGVVMASLIISSSLVLRAGSESLWFCIPVFVLSSFAGNLADLRRFPQRPAVATLAPLWADRS